MGSDDSRLINKIQSAVNRYPNIEEYNLSSDLGNSPVGIIAGSDPNTVLVAFENEIVLYDVEQKYVAKAHRLKRGKYVWMGWSIGFSQPLVEIQYVHFANKETAEQVYEESGTFYLDEPIDGISDGGEREVYLFDPLNGAHTPIGLTRKLVWAAAWDTEGDEQGYFYDLAPVFPGPLEERIATDQNDLLESLGLTEGSKATKIGTSYNGEHSIYKIYERHYSEHHEMFNVYALLCDEKKHTKRLAHSIFFAESTKHMSFVDTPLEHYPTTEDPLFSPAAINSSRNIYVLYDKVSVEGKQVALLSPPPVNCERLQITEDGTTVTSFSRKNGASIYDLKSGDMIRKLPAPEGSINHWCITRDAARVVYLNSNGTVGIWNTRAFGTDGWARN